MGLYLILFPLLALVLGLIRRSQGRESPDMRFQRQHMDPGGLSNRSPTYCNTMMRRRGMANGWCKEKNTFVHEPLADVQAVCFQENVPCRNGRNNCYKSRSPMHITECNLKPTYRHVIHCDPNGGSRDRKCDYLTSHYQKHIIVACEGNPYVPVHLDN